MTLHENNYNGLAAWSLTIRQLTLKRLGKIPNEFINWRLNTSTLSFGHLVQHILDVDELFFNLNTSENKFKWILGTNEPHINIDQKTYKKMLEKLKVNNKKRSEIIKAFTQKSINKIIKNENNEELTIWWFLIHNVLEHETYHRGQIAAYLKILKGESTRV
ncbi:DinB family protein [Olleya sp. HaHaR_3_96]|uniref:DinB family protein n=1 Tax=Olleya sp. HaHaR_3_96 TaxID=2745560 RepID=UPI001C4F7B45|nr:DinB family protein [Olleya sp. HaHaR_3_96]QXP58308.1 DinB family protein [Olleya sp. HaHaR_3_96]